MAYLKTSAESPKDPGIHGIYKELARIEHNIRMNEKSPVSEKNIKSSLDYIYSRADCFDFVLPGFIFLMTKYKDTPYLSDPLKDEIRDMILGCKYWIDEGGYEKSPCYFTENHQILFHSNEYMAGQLYPDDTFENNKKTGKWHMEHAKEYILRWLDWRMRFGFCEWLSNTYYHEDMLALVPLHAFSKDEEISTKAGIIINLMFLDMSLNSFKGVYGSTHGRSYVKDICSCEDGTSPMRSMFLDGERTHQRLSPAAILLSIIGYKVSKTIEGINNDERTYENKQCMSLDPEEGKLLGVDPADMKNLTLYWGVGAFSHRLVVDNTLKVNAMPGYYLLERAKAYKEYFDLCDSCQKHTHDDADYTSKTKVNIYTYKTKDYMLSCAQDYKKGRFGFQHHIWQATLGEKAIVYTTHPGSRDYTSRPNCWAGNRILPKAFAHKNLLICMYNIPVDLVPDFVFSTHAYFPQEFMDETTESKGWFIGRKNNSYVAIKPLSGFVSWIPPDPCFYPYMGLENFEGEIKPYEINATGRSNVWVCQLGSLSEDESFDNFVKKISNSELKGDVFDVTLESEKVGTVRTGWNKPLIINNEKIQTDNYLRYDNPFIKMNRGDRIAKINYGDKSLILDFDEINIEEE